MITGPSEKGLEEKSQIYSRDSAADSTKRSREMQWRSNVQACEMYPILKEKRSHSHVDVRLLSGRGKGEGSLEV